MAQWLIDNGSDVHQGGDGPLMRAALAGYRIPMMELLVANGANVNARWNGDFPIIFAPCESLDPEALGWLLANGADPRCGAGPEGETALDYLIGSYVRSTQLPRCIDLLMDAGCPTRRGVPGVLEILRGGAGDLAVLLASDSGLIHKHFPDLDFGASGTRRLTLRGGTLLHVAAEYGNIEAARLLLNRGADVNARALTDDAGLGGQTPLFHAVSHRDRGLAVVQLLSSHRADLNIRARVAGHYEREDEVLECTALTYARLFPGTETQTVRFLEAHGAQE
jgi:ankyrin repeat protein